MVFIYKNNPKKNLSGNLDMANIVRKSGKAVKVEIKKKFYRKCCLCPSNEHRQQTEPDPN